MSTSTTHRHEGRDPFVRPRGLGALTLRLARARWRAGQGDALLGGAAVLAQAAASAIAITLVEGTWMFLRRSQHPTGLLAQAVAADKIFHTILGMYVGLAAFACALVLPSVVSLASASAQLGARSREHRLASLRLLGLSQGEVTRMALADVLVQSLLGVLLGLLVALATLPAWSGVTFQAVQIGTREMLMPAWLYAVVCLTLVVLSLVAATMGLRRVRISPLGVARDSSRRAVGRWRLLVFIAIVTVAFVMVHVMALGARGNAFVLLACVVGLVLLGVNMVGPYLLQAVARVAARLPLPAARVAARRVVAAPTACWRRAASVSVLAFIGGYLALMPFTYDPNASKVAVVKTFQVSGQQDFSLGALITVAAGFMLMATSLLVTQTSATIERAEQTRALRRMGADEAFGLRVMWLETFGPLVLASAIGFVLGLGLADPMHQKIVREGLPDTSNPLQVAIVLVAGLVVAGMALVATHPLHHRLLQVQERRND